MPTGAQKLVVGETVETFSDMGDASRDTSEEIPEAVLFTAEHEEQIDLVINQVKPVKDGFLLLYLITKEGCSCIHRSSE